MFIGENLPNQTCKTLSGYPINLRDIKTRIVLVLFWSAECAWCEPIDQDIKTQSEIWQEKVAVILVNANAYEEANLSKSVIKEREIPFPLILDEGRGLARLMEAQVTPHCFIFNKGRLVYRGAYNDMTFRQRIPTRFYVKETIDKLIKGEEPVYTETEPYGCVLDIG